MPPRIRAKLTRSRFNPDGETPRDDPIRAVLACGRHGRRFIRIIRLYAFGAFMSIDTEPLIESSHAPGLRFVSDLRMTQPFGAALKTANKARRT